MVVNNKRFLGRRAFTLIEVITVLIILGITIGIGYSSLASASHSSYSQIGQTYATEVENVEQNFYNEYSSYTPYPSDLTGISSPLIVTNTVASGTGQVSIAVGAVTGNLAMAYVDGSGVCQLVLVPIPVPSAPASTTTVPTVPPGTACNADLAFTSESEVATTSGGSAK
jgi:prepilin-type N-terminal cleavage/methylation domain-containing protein